MAENGFAARNVFVYKPEMLQQNACQAGLVIGYLVLLETYGESWWTSALRNYSFEQIWVGWGFIFYFAWFWAWAIPYLVLDQAKKPEWLYCHKIQQPGTAVGFKRLAWTIGVVLFNQIAGTLPAIYALYNFLTFRGMSDNGAFPRWWTVLYHLCLAVALEEVLFFSVHFTLHSRFLYRHIHKIHHEYKETIAITTHYVHIVEHLFGNLLPIFSSAMLLGSEAHFLSLSLWVLLAVQNALVTHSGYNFPWLTCSVNHDFHHYNYEGNYGIGLGLDALFGTDVKERTVAKAYRENLRPGSVKRA